MNLTEDSFIHGHFNWEKVNDFPAVGSNKVVSTMSCWQKKNTEGLLAAFNLLKQPIKLVSSLRQLPSHTGVERLEI